MVLWFEWYFYIVAWRKNLICSNTNLQETRRQNKKVQEILILKVTSENVAKVQKWWLQQFLNLCYVFAYNFYKQHLLQVKCYRRNEKNRGFHLIPKTLFQWMNPKVIGY